jgi:lactam utilization protein B
VGLVESMPPGQHSHTVTCALEGALDEEGRALLHIKPHGALYGMASRTKSVTYTPGAIDAHLP